MVWFVNISDRTKLCRRLINDFIQQERRSLPLAAAAKRKPFSKSWSTPCRCVSQNLSDPQTRSNFMLRQS